MPTPRLNPALRKRVLALVLAGASAGAIMAPVTDYFEGGDRTTAYRDMGGTWTICRGITHEVKEGDTRTVEQCIALDSAEGKKVLAEVDAGFVKRQPESRRAAFGDFVYNVGAHAFMTSTARRQINEGRISEGCDQLRRWVYVSGHVVQWQVDRREFERWLCQLEPKWT